MADDASHRRADPLYQPSADEVAAEPRGRIMQPEDFQPTAFRDQFSVVDHVIDVMEKRRRPMLGPVNAALARIDAAVASVQGPHKLEEYKRSLDQPYEPELDAAMQAAVDLVLAKWRAEQAALRAVKACRDGPHSVKATQLSHALQNHTLPMTVLRAGTFEQRCELRATSAENAAYMHRNNYGAGY